MRAKKNKLLLKLKTPAGKHRGRFCYLKMRD